LALFCLLREFQSELCATRIARRALVRDLLGCSFELGDFSSSAAFIDGDFFVEGTRDGSANSLGGFLGRPSGLPVRPD
jgi:hypothetical protein